MSDGPAAIDAPPRLSSVHQPPMPTLLNAGCGPPGSGGLPAYFAQWKELRVDVDAEVRPDVLADVTDLSVIPSESVDAVWSAHCIEHLFLHQIGAALSELHRVLKPAGFACIIVPDLQTVASYIVNDRLDETLYDSSAGPVTAHDILFGFGPAVAQGYTRMAHRCGFTPNSMVRHFNESRFAEVVLRRRANLELAALALKTHSASPEERDAILANLAL
jgi:SAM-dependent methyltransferase